MGFGTKDKEWPKKLNQFARELRPLTPDIRHGYGIDIHIFRDTKGEHTTKNSTWIQISEVKNRSKKDDNSNNGGSSNGSGGGGGGEESSSEKTKDLGKVSPPSPPPPPTQNPRSKTDEIGGDGGGDTPSISTCISIKKRCN